MKSVGLVSALLVCLAAASSLAQTDPTTLPLLSVGDLIYQGGFRLPAATYGSSSMNYSEGPLAYSAADTAIFIVGHSHHQQIAQFKIPPIVNNTAVGDLNIAPSPLQNFAPVLSEASGGNPQDLNRIGGLLIVDGTDGPELLVNAYEYYDAPGDNTHTTAVVVSPLALSTSDVEGFHTFEGGAGHTSGWMSPIPPEWRDSLGGTHLTGQSSGIPIIGRTSVGPSAFAFDPTTLIDSVPVPNPVPATRLLDFSLANPLHDDLSNSSGNNDLWTHLSRVTYGFIVPGTRTYATFGYSGGHNSGVCYKCTQNNGNTCGGYCAPDADDYYQFLWLWDVNDLLAIKNGELESHVVRPYWHGPFPTSLESNSTQIGGGSFDPASGRLFLTIQRADQLQGTYSNPPVVVQYVIDTSPDSIGVSVNLRLLLEGAYEGAGVMSVPTSFRDSVPFFQPFDDNVFVGTALEHAIADSMSTRPDSLIDWVLVSLRSDSSAASEVAEGRAAGILLDNANVVAADGAGLEFPNVPWGTYYVVIDHMNHLRAMSATPIDFSDGSGLVDFTTGQTTAFGTVHDPLLVLPDGPTALPSCDIDIDGRVTAPDFSMWLSATRSGVSGYQSSDCDLDGQVTVSDFSLWLKNTRTGERTHVR